MKSWLIALLASAGIASASIPANAQTASFEITRVPTSLLDPGLETRGGTRVLGINDRGQYVGTFGERNWVIWGLTHGFIHGNDGYGTQPGLPADWAQTGGLRLGLILGEKYPNPQYRYLDLAPSPWPSDFNERTTIPQAINNAGIVVGRLGSDYLDRAPFQAFRYDSLSGALQLLTVPGATSSEAVDVNEAGDIVGNFTDASGSHGFLLRNGVFTTIDLPSHAGNTWIGGINDLGDIVGRAIDVGENRSFILHDGNFELFSFSTAYTTAHDINNLGQIVGSVGVSGQRLGFFLDGTQSVLLDFAGGDGSTYAYTINNLGVIGGAIEGGAGVGFLATVSAVPEPGTALLWLATACAFTARRASRRRPQIAFTTSTKEP